MVQVCRAVLAVAFIPHSIDVHCIDMAAYDASLLHSIDAQNLFFWSDSFAEGSAAREGKSKSNVKQAERAVALMRYIIQQGYHPGPHRQPIDE